MADTAKRSKIMRGNCFRFFYVCSFSRISHANWQIRPIECQLECEQDYSIRWARRPEFKPEVEVIPIPRNRDIYTPLSIDYSISTAKKKRATREEAKNKRNAKQAEHGSIARARHGPRNTPNLEFVDPHLSLAASFFSAIMNAHNVLKWWARWRCAGMRSAT